MSEKYYFSMDLEFSVYEWNLLTTFLNISSLFLSKLSEDEIHKLFGSQADNEKLSHFLTDLISRISHNRDEVINSIKERNE